MYAYLYKNKPKARVPGNATYLPTTSIKGVHLFVCQLDTIHMISASR